MLAEVKKKASIYYRIDLAKEELRHAEFDKSHDHVKSAVDNAYQSIVNMLVALGIKYQYGKLQHYKLINWFNTNFVKTGKVDQEYGSLLVNMFKFRTMMEYDDVVDFSKERLTEMFTKIKKCIDSIENNFLSE